MPDDGLHEIYGMDFCIIRGVLSVPVINPKLWVVTVESLHDKGGLSLITNVRSILSETLAALVWILEVR